MAINYPPGVDSFSETLPYFCNEHPTMAVDAFRQASNSEQPKVRRMAISQLTKLAEQDAINAMKIAEERIVDDDSEVSSFAAEAIIALYRMSTPE